MNTVIYEGEAVCQYCEGETYEVLELDGRLATIQCLFCLRDKRRVLSQREQESPAREESVFRFQSGRHKGKTLDEVYMTEAGKRYLEYLSNNATVESIKVRVTEFLERCSRTP